MKSAWLNLVLRLSNRIYQKKQLLVGQEGIQVVGNIVSLIVLEIVLALVSFPLYLSVGSKNVIAFFEERGEYAKVAFDYKLRRILTVTGVMIIAFIWFLKAVFIVLVPSIFGPLPLYFVSNVGAPDLSTEQVQNVLSEAGIQNAQVVPGMVKPVIQSVQKNSGKNFTFAGTAEPNSTIVLFLADQQTAIYTGEVDQNGNWKIDHAQNQFVLQEGNHSISSFSYTKRTGTRSPFSDTQYFKIKTTLADLFARNIDILANWSVVILIAVGAFLVFLTI